MGLFNDNVSFYIFFVVVILMILLTVWQLKNNNKKFKTTIFTLGIFGTFTGIAWGLYNFDPNNIDNSISQLLGGLKTAFYTSIAGMIFTIILNIRDTIMGTQETANKSEGLEQNNILSSDSELKFFKSNIKEINKHLKENNDFNISKTDFFHKLLKNQFNKIDKSINNLIESIAQGASKAIVESLEKTLRDFNDNLKENFGENFNQLNQSCSKIIDWQEEYKEQVEQGTEHLKSATQAMEQTNEAYQTISGNLEQVGEVYSKIEQLITSSKSHVQVMTDLFEKHGNFIDKGSSTLEKMNKELDQTNQQVSTLTNKVQDNLTGQSQALTKFTEDISEELPKSLNHLNQVLAGLTEEFIKSYKTYLQEKGIEDKDNRG